MPLLVKKYLTSSPPAAALALLIVLQLFIGSRALLAAEEGRGPRFAIKGFIVVGNTLLPDKPYDDDPESPFRDFPTIQGILQGFAGPDKSARDVEQARQQLEHAYHEHGYPSVLVNIPEQTLEDGFVRLQVIESKVRRVRVIGNRYFTKEHILAKLQTLQEGSVLYMPHLQDELLLVNRSPDLRVEPMLLPGKRFGTVDVELRVKDQLPLHGSLELNNRCSKNTTELRLNAMLRYDNLWQREHSASLQYQTSPKDSSEVQVIAGSYGLPSWWHDDHRLALFGVWSDSDTAFGDGFRTVGKGYTLGGRYIMPLAAYERHYTHNVSLGFDYKNFYETSYLDETISTPISYLPFAISYQGTAPGEGGTSRFHAGLNFSFRGLVNHRQEFETKRYRGQANYVYLRLGLEREQQLPFGLRLDGKVDGQLADQPLVSNEQMVAGGMDSVRGYKESAAAGDDGIHLSFELLATRLLTPLLEEAVADSALTRMALV